MISGNVIRCDSGAPFSGVTVKVSDLMGNEIARTHTNMNGNYNFNFNSYDSSFKVTASYPGHVTLSKIVNLNFNGDVLYGNANFQLGPEPAVTITAPSSQFLNETFSFSLSFNNTGNETGFGPIIQLILPPQIQFNSATFLGSPVGITNVGVFPGNSTGTLTDPLSGLNVTGISGYRLYILEYPFGSFTKGQPNAVIDINALLLGNSTLGVPLNITAYPVFRFGANETGGTPLRGNASTAQVTPTVMKITKSSDAPEDETATGKNFPHTYTLILDIANGQTVSPVNIRDIIPKNLQFLKIISADGGSVIQSPSNSTSGGNLWIQFGSITGVLGPDKIITYQLYAPKYDNTTLPVLDNVTGATVNATNTANATGTYNSIPVSASDDFTIYLKSLAIQKGVTDTSTDPIQPKPTDVLKYDLNFQVSDYFSMNNFVIRDTLGDGQTFLANSSYIPRIVLHLPPGFGPSQNITLNFNLTNLNQFQMIHDNATGITYLTFNITQLLIDNGYTGILEGGNYTGTDHGATQGTLTFWSRIDINYQNPPDHPLVSKDMIDNNVRVNANLTNSGNSVTDTSGTRVVIVAPTAQKSIAYIKRNGQFIPITNVLLPGDEVTFSLIINVPTNNLEDFYLVDYLPIPLFRATQFTNLTQDTSNNPPLPGRWTLGPNNTLTDSNGNIIIPVLSVDSIQNTLRFYYGSVYNCTQPNNTVEVLFTVTATGDPFVDGLYLTNLLSIKYNNTFNDIFCDNQIVSFQIGEPVLNIVKTATPTTNLQAGSVVNYTITISNTGRAPAYNVVVKDDLLSNNPNYISSVSLAARYANGASITGLDLAELFTADWLNFTNLYPIYGVNSTNNTIIITYNATLNSTVYPTQVINNTAQIIKFTSLPLPESPNFVNDPTKYQSSASVQVRDVAFNKSYLGSQGGGQVHSLI